MNMIKYFKNGGSLNKILNGNNLKFKELYGIFISSN